jgi:hypothetical protein
MFSGAGGLGEALGRFVFSNVVVSSRNSFDQGQLADFRKFGQHKSSEGYFDIAYGNVEKPSLGPQAGAIANSHAMTM